MVILLTAEGVILSPRNMENKTKSQRVTAWVSFELIIRLKIFLPMMLWSRGGLTFLIGL
jgi:hypothetical protein